MARNRSTNDNGRNDLLAGAGAGAAAYVVGYVLSFLLVRPEANRIFGDSVPTWKSVAWFYYNAHFVNLVASGSVGPFGGTDTLNLLAESDATAATVLYVVPPLVLLAAGLGVAARRDLRDGERAAKAGAATVGGYGVLAALVAVLSTHQASGTFFGVQFSETVSVALGPAVVIAALLYPAVFGTAGAVLRTRL